MTSVLESNYIEPKRPYSQDELQQMRQNLYYSMRLGDTLALHQDCGHFYFVKKNGRKEREIMDTNNPGNCSVCWKFNKTPYQLRDKASKLVESYTIEFYSHSPSDKMSYSKVDLENSFYKWLYDDFN